MPRPYECRAAQLLQQVLDGQVTWRDAPGAPPGTHDFDLVLPDGRTIAVEVTSATDPKAKEFCEVVAKARWRAPTLTRSWLLGQTGTNVRALRKQVEPLLRQLENAEVWQFDEQDQQVAQLVSLGVRRGAALNWGQPHEILVTGGEGGAVDPEFARMAVEVVAWAQDNRDKLSHAGTDERHLVVWIDPLGPQAFASMRAWRSTPPRCCCLPPEVDVLWVGRPCQTDESGRIVAEDLWRFKRGTGWEPILGCGRQA